MAKPYRFGALKKAEYLSLLREGMRRGAAAEAVGVTRETVRQHMKKEPQFADEVDMAEIDACELVEDALFQAAQSGNVPSMIFYLTNRSPDRWKNTQRQEVTGKDGTPLFHAEREDMSNFTTEELEQLLAIHEAAEQRRNLEGVG